MSVEAKRLTMKLMPKGSSILPSIPPRKKRGIKLTMMMSVELKTGIRTSFEASKTTSNRERRDASGKRAF